MSEEFWIDDCFRVNKDRFLWKSYLKDGTELVSGISKETVISSTRFYLKGKQEGWSTENSRVVNDGKVGGKL